MTTCLPWSPDVGPWAHEPHQWEEYDTEHDIYLVAQRYVATGHWCGYVDVPPGHRWHGQPLTWNAFPGALSEASCWGISYANRPTRTPDPRPDHWRVGFDCNHLHDANPAEIAAHRLKSWDADYATFDQVRRAVRAMHRVAVEYGKGGAS